MDTLEMTDEQEKNLEVARRINREARGDPSSPYVGKVIGVWRGEVVVAADTLGEAVAFLNALPAPEEAIWIEADVDYDTPVMIWRL